MKIKHIIITLVSILLLLSSCEKNYKEDTSDDYFEMNQNTLVFNDNQLVKSFTVLTTSSDDWTIEKTYDSWIKVTRQGNKIIVTAEPYSGVGERSTEIKIKYKGGIKTYVVSQQGENNPISIDIEEKKLYFEKEAGSKIIGVKTQSKSWQVSTINQSPWLTWDADYNSQTLTLKLAELTEDDPLYNSKRKEKLFISNGNIHIALEIVQNGGAQFVFPIYMKDATRAQIEDAEQKLDHTRDFEFDKLFYPRGEPGDKVYMGYSNDGEQVALSVYYFDHELDEKCQMFSNEAYMLAPEGKDFVEEDIVSFMEYNGFKPGRPMTDNRSKYYLEEADKTILCEVDNKPTAKLHGFCYPGAFIRYREFSNYISIESDFYGNDKISSFPVRDTRIIGNKKYKLKEIIEYERSQGMIPDYEHELTKKGNIEGLEYEDIVFKAITPSSEAGTLKYVTYAFNHPGRTIDYYGTEQPDLRFNLSPDMIGTVGIRQDIYNGNHYIYDKRPLDFYNPDSGYAFYIKNDVNRTLGLKGYDLVRSSEFGDGFTSYVRGVEDLIDVSPVGEMTSISFYKSKELVSGIDDSNQ